MNMYQKIKSGMISTKAVFESLNLKFSFNLKVATQGVVRDQHIEVNSVSRKQFFVLSRTFYLVPLFSTSFVGVGSYSFSLFFLQQFPL